MYIWRDRTLAESAPGDTPKGALAVFYLEFDADGSS
jgi:hypothetical protein